MIKKILTILIICLLLVSCKEEVVTYTFTSDDINNLDYSNLKEFDFSLHSKEYMLVCLSDFKVLYGKDLDKKIYPASLTKVLTMDTVLHLFEDLNDTSTISEEQLKKLYEDDASLAYLDINEKYTIEELLYALILPSGGDAAVALSNYFESKGYNLVDEMNKLASSLGCTNSHFTNPTGLHDDDLYTTLNDYFLIVLDTLQNDYARKILKSTFYRAHDDTPFMSTLLRGLNDNVNVLGGKTGTTDESGQSVMVFYEKDNRNYMLIVANALGYKQKEYFHMEDILKIFDELYKEN